MNVLSGIRVLDFTWVLAGPFATRILADYGAEVIKIQSLETSKTPDKNNDPYYLTWNRNKRSIALNMQTEEGRELFFKLVKICDVVVDNFSPHVMKKWGIDYERLSQINPGIIMAQISAAGHDEKEQEIIGFGPGLAAMSGFTTLASYKKDEPLGPGFAYADHVMGIYASASIVKAIYERRESGKGAYIDISGIDSMKSVMKGQQSKLAFTQRVKDGSYIAVSPDNKEQYLNAKKIVNNNDAEDIAAELQNEGIAAHKVYDSNDLFNDEHLACRKFFGSIESHAGKMLIDQNPIGQISNQPFDYSPAPAFGEANDYVFGQLLSLSNKTIRRYIDDGIIR